MASLIMSAAVPWMGELMAFRSANPRTVKFAELMSLSQRFLPISVCT